MRKPVSLVVVALSLVVGLIVAVPGASADPFPPNPIDPSKGELNLLNIIDSLPLNEIESALDHFPIPYVVVVSAGGAGPFIDNKKAGSPIRINADDRKDTGKGGADIIVEVNTELLPSPHLVVDIDRIGNAPFAEDLSVIVAFPFAAFSDEVLPASPNLFFGYATDPGGHAPESVQIALTPDILAGTAHTFEMGISTTDPSGPLTFFGGHFDGDPGLTPINVIGFSAHADPVPASIALSVEVDFSQILAGGATNSDVSVGWDASAPSTVRFDYLENETFPFTTPDYNTTLTFDQMPVSERISLGADFDAGTITLNHDGSHPIGDLTLLHERADGLMITGVASDVPEQIDLTLGTSGTASIGVSANTMDLEILATQEGGFLDTSGFFGFDVAYLSLLVEDVPDLTAAWDADDDSFEVHVTNPGEVIPLVEFVMDDDAVVNGGVTGLDLPPSWGDTPTHHIFSLFDDGTHGTAAARAVHLSDAVLDLATAPVVGHHFEWGTTQAAPLQAYLETTTSSALTGEDIMVTCDVDNIPAGAVIIDMGFPPPTIDFSYSSDPPTPIDTVSCTGNVGTLNFLMSISQVPPEFGVSFDPDSSLDVIAGDGFDPPPTAFVGQVLLRLWDEEGLTGLPESDTLFGVPLRDAVAQVDEIPSFAASWADGPTGTDIGFDTTANTGPFAYLGGVQIQTSTKVELATPLTSPGPGTDHYVSFLDEGADEKKRLEAGAFGIDHFSYHSTEGGGARTLAAVYAADEDHRLTIDIDSAMGGRFFPDYAVTAEITVDDVPQTWAFTTNLSTELAYVGSDGIAAITLDADVTVEAAADTFETTHVAAEAIGLPAEMVYFLDPVTDGSAFVHMNAPIGRITVELTSDDAILEGPYRHMLFNVEDIPANWDAEWGVNPNLHGSLVTSSPLGPVEIVVSRDVAANTPAKYDAFIAAGGAVDYDPFTREIDRRYFKLGSGDEAHRQDVFMTRLDSIYDTTAQLDEGEDHVILRENANGDMDFLSIRGTGLQSASANVTSTTVNASLEIPVPGDHPFYVGLDDGAGEFTVVQIDNIPDTTTVDVGTNHANIDFNSSPGDILVYQGPLPVAGQTVDVLKLLAINTPSFVHVNWDLGFPGDINVDTDSQTEVRLLSQSGNDRTVVDFAVGDISADWGFDSGTWTDKCDWDGCGEYLIIAQVYFDFEASPALEGFMMNYERIGSPSELEGGGPSPGGAQYVPRTSVLLDGFSEFAASVEFEVCVFGFCAMGVPTAGHTIETDLLGSFNFDWWDLGGDGLGDPDYVDNDPWDFWPIFHDQADHLFPFN